MFYRLHISTYRFAFYLKKYKLFADGELIATLDKEAWNWINRKEKEWIWKVFTNICKRNFRVIRL